jgi:hypothetical protein
MYGLGGYIVKRLVVSITACLAVFSLVPRGISAEDISTDRFEKVVNRMVKAINEGDYIGVQADFGQVMLEAFPLEKSEPFFRNLSAQYGRIEKLEPAQLISPQMAVFPAVFEQGVLDIKVVLDEQDKITGLWFLPHTDESAVSEEDQKQSEAEEFSEQGGSAEQTAAAAKAVVSDANTTEPNISGAQPAKENGPLTEALDNIDKESRREFREWTRSTVDEGRMDLAKAVQEQIMAEYEMIRNFAVKEGAVKTTEAIDRLIAQRTERFEKMLEKMKEEKEKNLRRSTRSQEREPRRRDQDRRTDRDDRTYRTRRSRTQDNP